MNATNCEVCGVDIRDQPHCTNRLCIPCHRDLCTDGGATYPGHKAIPRDPDHAAVTAHAAQFLKDRIAEGGPTPEQMAALERWKAARGYFWRSLLADAWLVAGEGVSDYEPALQQLRNNFGPSWLAKVKL